MNMEPTNLPYNLYSVRQVSAEQSATETAYIAVENYLGNGTDVDEMLTFARTYEEANIPVRIFYRQPDGQQVSVYSTDGYEDISAIPARVFYKKTHDQIETLTELLDAHGTLRVQEMLIKLGWSASEAQYAVNDVILANF